MYIASIDPGKQGAISLLNKDSCVKVVEYFPMPLEKNLIKEKEIKNILNTWHPRYKLKAVIIEKQIVISGQGIISSSQIKEHFGFLKGLCLGLDLDYIILESKTWQKIIPENLYIPKEIEKLNIKPVKKKSLAFAQLIFPELNLYRTKRCRKPSDGISDSIVMGYFHLIQSNN